VETAEPTMTPMTELATLPGLETVPAVTPDAQLEPQHWIERGPQKRLMLFSGRSHRGLAEMIGERLGVELGEVKIGSFANGETYCRFEESIRGADVFLVQTGCEPVDRNLMELLIMIQAAKLASAKRITAVMPWYPYARQDRKARPREPITAKLVADMLQTAGADRVLTMDLHAGQIQGFFSIPVDHMVALPLFAQHFRDQGLMGEGVVSVAPDAGRAKMAVKFAELIDADFAIMHKTRPGHDQAAVTEVTGNVRGKVAIVGDDVIMTGGTLLAGAHALRDAGATRV
jgi:ribose-phosphate pyrophosphokinase